MKNTNTDRIENALGKLKEWVVDLALDQIVTRRILRELSATMTPEQKKIIQSHKKYKAEITKEKN
jgi:hypothetical protein